MYTASCPFLRGETIVSRWVVHSVQAPLIATSELVQTVTAASRFTTVSALCITPIRVVSLWLREGDIFCAG
jgi:hypothetical protein